MAKMKNKIDKPKDDNSAQEPSDSTSLSSLEDMILRMRFGLGKDGGNGSFDRNLSEDLRKKLQFLELKAFEQTGRIKELLSDIEKKGKRN